MNYPECPQCHAQGKAKLHLQAPRFLRCDECGVMYWDPFPSAASLARLYYEGWKSPTSNTRETGSEMDPDFGTMCLVGRGCSV
jgi:hypothetical protein